ncbi:MULTISPECIES: hypothetical protein [Edaphocola]|jgi:hypothetical protein|nr:MULTISPECIES: hypothetical protein [Edaphocola]
MIHVKHSIPAVKRRPLKPGPAADAFAGIIALAWCLVFVLGLITQIFST